MVQIMEQVEEVIVAHDKWAQQEQVRLLLRYAADQPLDDYAIQLYLYLASEI